MDWNDVVEITGVALKHDQETILEMSMRIAQLEAENERQQKEISLLKMHPQDQLIKIMALEVELGRMTDIANKEHASSAHIAMRNGELEEENERIRDMLCGDCEARVAAALGGE